MKKICFLLMLALAAQMVIAQDLPQESQIQEMEKTQDITTMGFLIQATSSPTLKLCFFDRFNIPFLQGIGPLTKDNSINLGITGELSPVSLNAIIDSIWTPIAFFQLSSGGRIGTGWNISLFGNDIYGIGLNRPDEDGKSEHSGSSFGGFFYKAHMGAALQADLAAVLPGNWKHVVMRTYHEINYSGFSRAGKRDSWYFESDEGENCNGFNYYFNFLLGYQMPIFFNLVAVFAEGNRYLYDTPDRTKWGEDYFRWTFSLIMNFTLTKNIEITLIPQLWTRRNYLEENWSDLYYRNCTVKRSNPYHLEFYRVAGFISYKF